MKHYRHLKPIFLAGAGLMLLSGCQPQTKAPEAGAANLAELGQRLYFDTNLSLNRTQSCASCHDPAKGFVDPAAGADSLGDDGHSHGGRNAPTASYAALTPEFHRDSDGSYKGGQFHDGRASTLADQAMGPPLNPAEMGMTSKALVLERLNENPFYRESFRTLFDDRVLQEPERGYSAMAESIAAFERTELFSPFDSKYDRYLRGEYQMTEQEELGRTLFFSQQFTNCNQCHQLQRSPLHRQETFTDYSYRNIGVPSNPELNRDTDQGLAANTAAEGSQLEGKFKVPTLRNVAITSPYMHNGVFKDLRTVVLFYDHYNSRNSARAINPETGNSWGDPEVEQNLAQKELKSTPALDDRRVDALVAFMKTLTDKRFEPLLASD